MARNPDPTRWSSIPRSLLQRSHLALIFGREAVAV
jgi:hypothetical protein